jgi:hypothetical protein
MATSARRVLQATDPGLSKRRAKLLVKWNKGFGASGGRKRRKHGRQ